MDWAPDERDLRTSLSSNSSIYMLRCFPLLLVLLLDFNCSLSLPTILRLSLAPFLPRPLPPLSLSVCCGVVKGSVGRQRRREGPPSHPQHPVLFLYCCKLGSQYIVQQGGTGFLPLRQAHNARPDHVRDSVLVRLCLVSPKEEAAAPLSAKGCIVWMELLLECMLEEGCVGSE